MAKKKKAKKAKRGQKKAGAKRPGRKARAPAAQQSADKGDLEGVLNGLRTTYGEGSIQLLKGDWAASVEVLPTGHKGFDHDLMGNLGGLPRGRMIEVFGAESAGKTTVALYWVAAAQRAGGTVVFIDAEHALDPEYAAKLGVDTEKLLLAQPDSGEQALDITRQLIESGQIDMIVIDSVAALVPEKELEGEIGDAHVGLQARMLSQACRMLSAGISQTNTILVWINQIREKVGVMFGNPEVTPGGRAIKFYSSVRVEVRHGATVKNAQDKIVGKVAHLKAVKNKVAPPFGTTDFVLMFDQEKNRWGVDIFKAAYAYAIERGILVQNGSWITTSWGVNRFQGEEKFRAAIEANEELRREFYQMVESESPALPAAVEAVPTEAQSAEVS